MNIKQYKLPLDSFHPDIYTSWICSDKTRKTYAPG